MNGTTLQALRLSLGYTPQEAAYMVAAVPLATWKNWESNAQPIPDEIENTLRNLVSYKRQLIEEARGQLLHICNVQGMPESISLTYYGTETDWLTQQDATAVQWKPHCMAMAALAEEFPVIELVLFDNNAYQSWLDGRLDSQLMRDQWASVVTR